MSGDIPFHLTRRGARFFDADLPRLIDRLADVAAAFNRVADAGEKLAEIVGEVEAAKDGGHPSSPRPTRAELVAEVARLKAELTHGPSPTAPSVGPGLAAIYDDRAVESAEMRMEILARSSACGLIPEDAGDDEVEMITESMMDAVAEFGLPVVEWAAARCGEPIGDGETVRDAYLAEHGEKE